MSERNQKHINQFFANLIARIRKWLIKIGSPFRISRRFVRALLNQVKGQSQARKVSRQGGFVLPTTVMVTLVVTLLVVVLVARSSERARSASDSRVEQVFASSTKPAIDRARAKIEGLINDDALGRGTPSDSKLDLVVTRDLGKYTFRDETRLQLITDGINPPNTLGNVNIDNGGSGDNDINNLESISSAWRFPIDTDNNGKYDSLGLYSIVFRTRPPYTGPSTPSDRKITPIEVRALPVDESALSATCVGAGVSGAVTDTGWTQSSDKLKKSFFVYALTVPLTDITVLPTTEQSLYENFQGNSSFNVLELQQDRLRFPVNNNAVWFEGDLELSNIARLNLNGRVYTSGSLMVAAADTGNPITFFQVSSQDSCYYKEENSKLITAGNVVEGDAYGNVSGVDDVFAHLFRGAGVNPTSAGVGTLAGQIKRINDTNQTVTNVPQDVVLNDFAYNNRITAIVNQSIGVGFGGVMTVSFPSAGNPFTDTNINSADPLVVKRDIARRINDEGLSSINDFDTARIRAYQVYFGQRMRKVPYKEVLYGTTETFPATLITVVPTLDGTEFSPPLAWMIPPDTNAAFTSAYTAFDGRGLFNDGSFSASNSLTLKVSSPLIDMPTTYPPKQKDLKEQFLGDRLRVGNNLPAKWLKKDAAGNFFFAGAKDDNFFTTATGTINWNQTETTADTTSPERIRNSQASTLESLGVSDRGGFWELSAADDPSNRDATTNTDQPANPIPTTGGLRVVTNAGIFSRRPADTFLPRYLSGLPDDTTTTAIDESSAIADNPVTAILENTFAGTTFATNYVVWPDSMPMTGGPSETKKGDLQMRATVLYHYKWDTFNPAPTTLSDYQLPIACVSSYYDPSTSITARNISTLPWNASSGGRSNNGIVYSVPASGLTPLLGSTGGVTYSTTTGRFTVPAGAENPSDTAISVFARLAYQANLIFPNGRFANDALRPVLQRIITAGSVATANLTLPEQSTIDSNICALGIMTGEFGGLSLVTDPVSSTVNGAQVPHGSTREAAFLDGREVKSLNRNETLTEAAFGANTANGGYGIAKNRGDIYDLEIEQRQPLEIRVTDIDIDRLRGARVTGPKNSGVTNEFLLPYSGIIYASRDDAQRDLSYFAVNGANDPIFTSDNTRNALSSTDFRLDPTRRPNGIRLINGYRLWRSALVTGNLANTDGSLAVSDTAYNSGTYDYSTVTRGEKGLILVSNLPVYVKAQRDPVGTLFAFNRHTRQEFTNLLNENTASPGTIWSNFYNRTTSQLDSNFACRPAQSPLCTNGDQWRPATIIADTATVLSASFRDGFRSDGDYDLRNNSNTSVSINWQSLLNSNSEEAKDSTYVIQRRKLGFFNNNYLTSANWLPNASANATDTNNQFPSDPVPGDSVDEEKRNSYNANGVTPVQRRLAFGEYNMEICRKLPLSECSFSDWAKGGAGTTAMVSRAFTPSPTPTPTPAGIITLTEDLNNNGIIDTGEDTNGNGFLDGAPRYISAQDERFGRRLSFLRYNDIYGDGNYSLVMGGICPGLGNPLSGSGNQVWPMPIAVVNGNQLSGYTYPQFMGGLNTPFNASGNFRAYGDIPCPSVQGARVKLVNLPNNRDEGRRRNLSSLPTYPATLSNLLAPSGNLPAPNFTNQTSGTFSTTGNVTNQNDPGTPVSAPLPTSANTPNPFPPPSAQVFGDAKIYKRFDFQVQVDNLPAASGTVTVNMTLSPSPAPVGTPATPGAVGDPPQTADTPAPQSGTDYLNNFYVCTDASTCTSTALSSSTSLSFPVSGSNTRFFTVLVVRDSATENNEFFRVQLTAPTNAVLDIPNVADLQIRQGQQSQSYRALGSTGNTNPLCPTGPSAAPGRWGYPGDDGVQPANAATPAPASAPCPTPPTPPTPPIPPTPTPPTPIITMLPPPVFGLLPLPVIGGGLGLPTAALLPDVGSMLLQAEHLAAAYPYFTLTPSPTPVPNPYLAAPGVCGSTGPSPTIIGPIPSPTPTPTPLLANTYNYNCTLPTKPDFNTNASIFGPAPVSNYAFPQVPPKPNSACGSACGDAPMLPGMTNVVPSDAPRALWFRTAGNPINYMGETDNTQYSSGQNLMIYNMSWPSIGGGTLGMVNTNLNMPSRIVLPETVCIDTANARVDERCNSVSYDFGTLTPLTGPVSVANLNLPFNPYYPSDNVAAINLTSPTIPASAYAVCGAAGNSRGYQSIMRRPGSAGSYGKNDISDDSPPPPTPTTATNNACDTNPTSAIATFTGTANGLRSPNLDPDLSNALLFKGQLPTSTGTLNTSGALTLTANNTFADNRVQVVNLRGLDTSTTASLTTSCPAATPTPSIKTLSGTLTLRSNQSVTAPSPVFILQGCSTQDLVLQGLKVKLEGVDPNNVFWVISKTGSKALTIQGASVLTGNFLGITPSSGAFTKDNSSGLSIANSGATTGLDNVNNLDVALRSVRFLGFRAIAARSSIPTQNNPSDTAITTDGALGINRNTIVVATTTVNQPIVLPVLQIHSPITTAAGGGTTLSQPSAPTDGITGDDAASGANANTGKWTQRASNSEINVYFVAGNSPSRVRVPYTTSVRATIPGSNLAVSGGTAEGGGGLANFIRFLENWVGRSAKITGGFIQNGRSVYATAPVAVTGPYGAITNLRGSADTHTLFINPYNSITAGQALSSYKLLYQSVTGQGLPFFSPPFRLWGFDVGLLSQSADRFAERFSTSIPTPNEYFREVGKDDGYVKNLMCALEPSNPAANNPATGSEPLINPSRPMRLGTAPANYTKFTLYKTTAAATASGCTAPNYN